MHEPTEQKRLEALRRYDILDTEPENTFDRLTRIGSALFDVPVCAMSLVDEYRVWCKSIVGMQSGDTPREHSICNHAIQTPEKLLIVRDAESHPDFSKNPHVAGDPNLRFYAGAPLVSVDGGAVGMFCVVSFQPRHEGLTPEQETLLHDLAALAVTFMDSRLERKMLQAAQSRLQVAESELIQQIRQRECLISDLEAKAC